MHFVCSLYMNYLLHVYVKFILEEYPAIFPCTNMSAFICKIQNWKNFTMSLLLQYLSTNVLVKVGWSANKFRKSQSPNWGVLNILLDLQTFCKCGTLRICNWTQSFLLFADLKLPQVRKYCTYIFSLKLQQMIPYF